MVERNIVVTIHYNGSIFTYINVEFSFSNTETQLLKIHVNSDFIHLKDRIEKLCNIFFLEISYQRLLINGDDDTLFYIMTQIENDEDVKLMFLGHKAFAQLNTIELYVFLMMLKHI